MVCATKKIIELIIPAVITIIGNVIFYAWIKKRVDKSINAYKIAYSGVFNEKINIYREILGKSYKIKRLVIQYNYIGAEEGAKDFLNELEDFINFYLKNQPFLSEKMLDTLKKIHSEFQFIFDKSYQYFSINNSGIDSDTKEKYSKLFWEARNKVKNNNPFEELEVTIIKEMKKDLKMENFKNN